MKKDAQNPIGSLSSATPWPALSEFLASGWLLQLNSRQILIGWGAEKDPRPQKESGVSLFAPPFYLEAVTEASRSPKNPEQNGWLPVSRGKLVDRSEFATFVLAGVAPNVNAIDQGFQWVEPSRADFDKQWQEIRSGMCDRGLQKAVPIVFAKARAELSEARRLRVLQSLARLPANLFIYGCWSALQDKSEGLLGATPEVLFSQIGDDPLETVALAGTRGKITGPDAGEKLFDDPKERHEHQLVIDDIRTVLEKIGEVVIGETGVVELPTLFHLKTPIQARLKQSVDLERLARLLHPTPALGVAPRILGFDEMRRWETLSCDRHRYGAPFGASFTLEDGTRLQHCLVAIRNIQWQGDEVILGSGCGVVPESDPDREWQELILKRDSVKRMLGV